MKASRKCRNAMELSYDLLRYVYDHPVVSHSELIKYISDNYSSNYITIRTHIKNLLKSGFIKVNSILIKKQYTFYYFERNEAAL